MRLGPITRAFACLLAAGALLAGCGSSDSTDTSGAAAENRPAPPKSDFPATEGRSLTEVLEAAGPSELVVSPGRVRLLQGREPLPLRRLRKGPQPGHRRRGRPLLRRRSRRSTRKPKKRAPRAPKRGPQIKALEEPATGPFPA